MSQQDLQEQPGGASGAAAEDQEFSIDEVTEIAVNTLERVLGDSTYIPQKVQGWNNAILERMLGELVKLKKPFKYIVTCSLQQRTGAGLHLASANYWDRSTDGICTVRWDNQFIHCCLIVYGVQI